MTSSAQAKSMSQSTTIATFCVGMKIEKELSPESIWKAEKKSRNSYCILRGFWYIVRHEYQKTENCRLARCVSLSLRWGTTCYPHGKISRCRSDFRVFLRGELFSEGARFFREDDFTRQAGLQEGNKASRSHVPFSDTSKDASRIRYRDFFGELSRCNTVHEKRRKGVLLLSYASEISVRFSRSVSRETPENPPRHSRENS